MLRVVSLGAAVLLATSCATIVGDADQVINMSSAPDGARVSVVDEKGVTVFEGDTPTQVSLKKSDGTYFGGKSYTITITKDGHQSRTVSVNAKPNGWYIAGNLVFGGLIGWLVVDPLNGHMYNLSPETVDASLGEGADAISDQDTISDQNLSVVLYEEVPRHLRGKMKRVRGKMKRVRGKMKPVQPTTDSNA